MFTKDIHIVDGNGNSFAGLSGVSKTDEDTMLLPIMDAYKSAFSNMETVLRDSTKALSSFGSDLSEYQKKVQSEVAKGFGSGFLLGPLSTVASAVIAAQFISETESKLKVSEKSKKIYQVAYDNIQNIYYTFSAVTSIRISDFISYGIITSDQAEEFLNHIDQNESLTSIYVNAAMKIWARKVRPEGWDSVDTLQDKFWSQMRISQNNLTSFASSIGMAKPVFGLTEEGKKVIPQIKDTFLKKVRDAKNAALAGKKDPGILTSLWNSAMRIITDPVGLVLACTGFLGGLVFVGFELAGNSFLGMKKMAVEASEFMNASLGTVSIGASYFTKRYSELQKTRSTEEAKNQALSESEKVMEEKGKILFQEAQKNIDYYFDYSIKFADAFDHFIGKVKEIFGALMLGAGIVVGGFLIAAMS